MEPPSSSTNPAATPTLRRRCSPPHGASAGEPVPLLRRGAPASLSSSLFVHGPHQRRLSSPLLFAQYPSRRLCPRPISSATVRRTSCRRLNHSSIIKHPHTSFNINILDPTAKRRQHRPQSVKSRPSPPPQQD